jgi:ATP-dependent Lon protease
MDFQIAKLKEKLISAKLPVELNEKINTQLERLQLAMQTGGASSYGYYEQTSSYLEWIINLPWQKSSQDILDITRAKTIFNKNHYGLDQIKQRILEYLSVIILQRQSSGQQPIESQNAQPLDFSPLASDHKQTLRAPILCFVGLVGTGKTTMAISMAEALNRQLIRIPFGGLASALDLRGLSRIHPEAEPGIIIKALRRVQVNNPVILLDELDRVSNEKRQEIMGVLVELLDPEQNKAFTDHYVDFPFDLSQSIFVATANNTEKVATAVMDRMEVIQMPSYTDEEKIHIGKEYLLPGALKEAGLSSQHLKIDDKVWPILIRPLGFDSGIRTLKRITQTAVRKAAWKILNHEGNSFTVNESNYREFMG